MPAVTRPICNKCAFWSDYGGSIVYMRRLYLGGRGKKPIGWICMRCGHIILDSKAINYRWRDSNAMVEIVK